MFFALQNAKEPVQSKPVKDLANNRLQPPEEQRASERLESLFHPHERGQKRTIDDFQLGQVDGHAIQRAMPAKTIDHPLDL